MICLSGSRLGCQGKYHQIETTKIVHIHSHTQQDRIDKRFEERTDRLTASLSGSRFYINNGKWFSWLCYHIAAIPFEPVDSVDCMDCMDCVDCIDSIVLRYVSSLDISSIWPSIS